MWVLGVLLFARGTCFKGWVWSTGEKHHLYLRNVQPWAPDLNCCLYANKIARWFAWTFGFERHRPELNPKAPAAREHGKGALRRQRSRGAHNCVVSTTVPSIVCSVLVVCLDNLCLKHLS